MKGGTPLKGIPPLKGGTPLEGRCHKGAREGCGLCQTATINIFAVVETSRRLLGQSISRRKDRRVALGCVYRLNFRAKSEFSRKSPFPEEKIGKFRWARFYRLNFRAKTVFPKKNR